MDINIFDLFRSKKKTIKTPQSLLSHEQLKKLHFSSAINRVLSQSSSDLIFDPVGFNEYIWIIKNKKEQFISLMMSYTPKRQITYNMPKQKMCFRPVSYLNPVDSIIYQAVVDIIIRHKRNKFSKYVYSNYINDIDEKEVFHKPVLHWLEMRSNIRKLYRNGQDIYFFCDVAGYYENIKISKLLGLVDIYIGRNEVSFKQILKTLLERWQFASSQGLIQPHHASAILSKIYLSQVDSKLFHIGNRYHRYVDEFHIMTKSEKELYKIGITLNEALRELGLNLNYSKNELLNGESIKEKFDQDNDYFQAIHYFENIKHDYEMAYDVVIKRFDTLVKEYYDDKEVNWAVFRNCIRKFTIKKDPVAIDFVLVMMVTNCNQTVDCVKYLQVFIQSEYSTKIFNSVISYIEDENKNIYPWVQIWLLWLLSKYEKLNHTEIQIIREIAINKNNDHLSRATAYMCIAKIAEDTDLLFSIDEYNNENILVIKRALLCCISKLPSTIKSRIFEIENDDDIEIKVLKSYLLENDYPFVGITEKTKNLETSFVNI